MDYTTIHNEYYQYYCDCLVYKSGKLLYQIIFETFMGKHPKKDMDKAIKFAISHGWIVEKAGSSSHAWGIMKCPYNDPICGSRCISSIYSTPKSSINAAKRIIKDVTSCQYYTEL